MSTTSMITYWDGTKKPITKASLELVQYVQEIYDSGAKMWTKEMFLDLEAELSKDPQPESIMMRCMNGKLLEQDVPSLKDSQDERDGVLSEDSRPQHIAYFVAYQETIYDAERYFSSEKPTNILTYQIKSQATLAIKLCTWERSPSDVDYSTLRAGWDNVQQGWLESTGCKELTGFLETATFPKIKNIVCFGLGTFGNLDETHQLSSQASRAQTQHAAALTMAKVLGRRLGIDSLPVLLQDPAYTSPEKQLLAELGFEVVGGHGSLGFTLVDDETLVFSSAPNVPVKQIIADIATPAVMIWDSIQSEDEDMRDINIASNAITSDDPLDSEDVIPSSFGCNDDFARTRKMAESYKEFDFPSSCEEERFGDVKIYIRKD